MVTGGFHLLVAVAGGWDMWRDIIMDGFAASIGNDAERAYAFVFFVGGILLLLHLQSETTLGEQTNVER